MGYLRVSSGYGKAAIDLRKQSVKLPAATG
jgi:hypothetical protein